MRASSSDSTIRFARRELTDSIAREAHRVSAGTRCRRATCLRTVESTAPTRASISCGRTDAGVVKSLYDEPHPAHRRTSGGACSAHGAAQTRSTDRRDLSRTGYRRRCLRAWRGCCRAGAAPKEATPCHERALEWSSTSCSPIENLRIRFALDRLETVAELCLRSRSHPRRDRSLVPDRCWCVVPEKRRERRAAALRSRSSRRAKTGARLQRRAAVPHPCPSHSLPLPRPPLSHRQPPRVKTHVPCATTHRPRRTMSADASERENEPGGSGPCFSKSGCGTRMGARRCAQASPLPLRVSTAAR